MKAWPLQLVAWARHTARAFGLGGVQNALACAGAGLVTYGAGLVYAPAGFVTAGVFCLAAAWLMSRAFS